MLMDPNRNNEEHNHIPPASLPSSVSVLIPEIPIADVDRMRKIDRVPPEMRLNKERSQHLYDPVIVSLGPYHHRESRLSRAEKLKDEILCKFLFESGHDRRFFYNPIVDMIDEIRDCYVEVSKDRYDDAILAEMMLRDGIFIIYYMHKGEEYFHTLVGNSGVSFMLRDFLMLENQIPYAVIKRLIELRYEENQGKRLICAYLSKSCFRDCQRLKELPWNDGINEEPLHLLDAARMTHVGKKQLKVPPSHCKCRWSCKKKKIDDIFESESNPFRSVMELFRKGIHFEPSSNFLTDVKFSSFAFYGRLSLPKWFATANSEVLFSNLIAFELSPYSRTDGDVTSYINFMKTLIETSEDVKKLREKRILFSNLGTEEEVVRLFKNIDTLAEGNPDIFEDVKKRMEEHCSSKSRTWMADLVHTYFRSPWNATALLAATFLLFLTLCQTYLTYVQYTADRKKGNQ